MNGPVPIDVRARLRTFGSMDSFGTMYREPGVALARRAVTTAFGAASFIETVLSSTAVMEVIGAAGLAAVEKSPR
jgi:hypothetical protein